MANAVGRPLAFESVEDLERAIDEYFDSAAYIGEGDERQYAPTMSGLALALGVDRKTITNYGNKQEFFPTIKKARSRVEVALEQRLYGQPVAGVIFNLKNNFGWMDQPKDELDSNAGLPLTINFEVSDPVKSIKVTKGQKKKAG